MTLAFPGGNLIYTNRPNLAVDGHYYWARYMMTSVQSMYSKAIDFTLLLCQAPDIKRFSVNCQTQNRPKLFYAIIVMGNIESDWTASDKKIL